ncbi:CVNH domain-containing protein [Aquabacter sp. CN5-332]|uniref:CVNH domain-containing protein n=1 Tax=Aquabacter sp. CN5-332 TaxID=3156608 RepID=UPI0032B4599A
MRARIGLLGLVGLLLGFAILPAAAAPPVPPGSYLGSCQRPAINKGMITAFCLNPAGAWVPAGLPLVQCPPGRDIVNDKGVLVCGGPLPGYRPPPPPPGSGWGGGGGGGGWGGGGGGWGGGSALPPGSYTATCQNANVDRGILNAVCRDRRGNWNATSINLNACRGRDIANFGGRLSCQ